MLSFKALKTSKKRKIIITAVFIICTLYTGLFVQGVDKYNLTNKFIGKDVVLLLNSNLSECESGFVKIILWTEQKKADEIIPHKLAECDLLKLGWKKQKLRNTYGNYAYKYTAEIIVDKKKEAEIPDILNNLAQKLPAETVKIHFEETIKDTINGREYFDLLSSKVKSFTAEDGIESYTANAGSNNYVKTGAEFVNIQVITAKKPLQPKTVLALPAILEEF